MSSFSFSTPHTQSSFRQMSSASSIQLKFDHDQSLAETKQQIKDTDQKCKSQMQQLESLYDRGSSMHRIPSTPQHSFERSQRTPNRPKQTELHFTPSKPIVPINVSFQKSPGQKFCQKYHNK